MRIFAFVFARGGSKGLPRKNIKELNGKPLLQYSIDVAKELTGIEKVFVSTDDAEIAQVAEKNGATVIQRPVDLGQDRTPEWLAWRHAIEWARDSYGEFDVFLSLPATSPLRNKEDVTAAIEQLVKTEADICIGVTLANRSPYFNMVKLDANGFCRLVNEPNSDVTRRQDAPVVYDITTVVYAANPNFIMNGNGLFSGRVTTVEIPKVRSVDIDDIYDFKMAEAILLEGMNDAIK